ncbi:MAG: hypothetical protein ACE15F_07630 [bacterium]
MELKIDNQVAEVTEPASASLREVIERVSRNLGQHNRVISEIQMNGQEMAGWDDPRILPMTVGTCRSLHLVSDEPRNLAHKILYEIAGFMPKIREALIETASLIQSRKEEEGMVLLEKITSTWAELYQGFRNSMIVTGLDIAAVSVQGKPFSGINETVHDLLGRVSEYVEDRRFLELSDLLEYELAPQMPLVEEGIYQLIKELERKTN